MVIPKVYVGQPQSHGQPREESSRAKFTGLDPSASDADRVEVSANSVAISGSLAQSFNSLLAAALDSRDAGLTTHFAMLHDDIWPLGPWITQLWRVMRTTGADLVSVVVPIKEDPPGRTSTAIGDRDDCWLTRRYIWLEDRASLPGTFTAEHVCQPTEVLLANTGCWLADITKPWWDEFADSGGFNQGSRITRTADGNRLAEFDPEDWRMSRFLEARGAKVACTWEVPLRHGGWSWWLNYPEESV